MDGYFTSPPYLTVYTDCAPRDTGAKDKEKTKTNGSNRSKGQQSNQAVNEAKDKGNRAHTATSTVGTMSGWGATRGVTENR